MDLVQQFSLASWFAKRHEVMFDGAAKISAKALSCGYSGADIGLFCLQWRRERESP
jgi:hypothetical protein